LFRTTGERWGLGISLTNAGISAEAAADYALAKPYFEESAAIFRDLGDDWALSLPLRHLGIVASRQQDYARAEGLYKESLALCRDFGERWLISLCLEELAGVARWQGEYPRAARLWGVGETLRGNSSRSGGHDQEGEGRHPGQFDGISEPGSAPGSPTRWTRPAAAGCTGPRRWLVRAGVLGLRLPVREAGGSLRGGPEDHPSAPWRRTGGLLGRIPRGV
jgi:hypothetical protein